MYVHPGSQVVRLIHPSRVRCQCKTTRKALFVTVGSSLGNGAMVNLCQAIEKERNGFCRQGLMLPATNPCILPRNQGWSRVEGCFLAAYHRKGETCGFFYARHRLCDDELLGELVSQYLYHYFLYYVKNSVYYHHTNILDIKLYKKKLKLVLKLLNRLRFVKLNHGKNFV